MVRRPSRNTAVRPKRRYAGKPVTDAPCRIRPALAADVPALVALERITFTDPWSHGDFIDCLAAGVLILVAEDNGIVAYLVGRSVRDEAEILNLGVAVGARRRGVASALVRVLLASFAGRGVRSVFLEVRESNLPARALYQSFHFLEVGRRERYYHRPEEDAVVLRAVISADDGSA